MSQRRRKTHIHGVEDQNREWCTCERHIATVAEQYFQGLFTTANPVNMETVLDSVERVVTRTMNILCLSHTHSRKLGKHFSKCIPQSLPAPMNNRYFHQGRVNDVGKITYMVWKTKMGNGVPVRDTLPQ